MTSRLATVANAAELNTFYAVCGESVPGDVSGWNHILTEHNLSGGVVSGFMSEMVQAAYDPERRWVILWGDGHQQQTNAGNPSFFGIYDIDANTVLDMGSTDPTGLSEAQAGHIAKLVFTYSTTGAAAGSASYIAVAQSATSGSGTGAKFNVTRAGGVYTVYQNILYQPVSYAAGNTITIAGSSVGGGSNITVTLSSVVAPPNGISNNGHVYELYTYVHSTRTAYRMHGLDHEMTSVDLSGRDFSAITSANWALNAVPVLPPSLSGDRGPFLYVPERNALWHLDTATGALFELNLSVGSAWTTLHTFSTTTEIGSDGTIMLYNAVRHTVILGGGAPGPSQYFNHFFEYDLDIYNPAASLGAPTRILDDISYNVYFSQGYTMGWIDPISGHFFVAAIDVTRNAEQIPPYGGTQIDRVFELDANAGAGSQWQRRQVLENAWPQPFGQPPGPPLHNAVPVTLWDQGVVLFPAHYNIYLLKTTANDRAGHETGDGMLTNADLAMLQGTLYQNAFSVPSDLVPGWDATDAGLTAAMNALGYTANTNVTYAPGSGNITNIRQPQLNDVYSIGHIYTESNGQNGVKLPLAGGSPGGIGENGATIEIPMFGSWSSVAGQRPWFGPNSPHGPTYWIAYDWFASQSYFDTVWRRVHYNYQHGQPEGTSVTVTSGSNIISVPGITNSDRGIYAEMDFLTGGWALGRQMAILRGTGLDPLDLGFFRLGAAVDATHIHVMELDGTTPHNFHANASAVGIAISGVGILDGVNDASIDGAKLWVLSIYSAGFDGAPLGGSFVLINARAEPSYARLTKSPNMYAYDGGIENSGILNDGTVPFIQNGWNRIVVRVEQTTTVHSSGGGIYHDTKYEWWCNGVGGRDYPQTHWLTAPGYWGDNDGAGFKFGPNRLELVSQMTYNDPNLVHPDAYVAFSNLTISRGPIPTSALLGMQTPPITPILRAFPFFFRRS